MVFKADRTARWVSAGKTSERHDIISCMMRSPYLGSCLSSTSRAYEQRNPIPCTCIGSAAGLVSTTSDGETRSRDPEFKHNRRTQQTSTSIHRRSLGLGNLHWRKWQVMLLQLRDRWAPSSSQENGLYSLLSNNRIYMFLSCAPRTTKFLALSSNL